MLDNFYIFKISYHFYELAHTLLLDRGRKDFPEYILHHLMTFALILFSYSLNCLPLGSVIMLVHDATDLPATLLKLVSDVTYVWVEVGALLFFLVIWSYLRLYVFPLHLIGSLIEEVYNNTVPSMNYNVMNMMFAFLIGLMGLHLFWTYMLFKALQRRVMNPRSNQVLLKDSASRIE